MDIRKVFGERFSEEMKYGKISYAELARRLNVTKASVSMYKHGKALPSLEVFAEICEILEVSADYLLGRKEM